MKEAGGLIDREPLWRRSSQQANVMLGKAGRQYIFCSSLSFVCQWVSQSGSASKLIHRSPPSYPLSIPHGITQLFVLLGSPGWPTNTHARTHTASAIFWTKVICYLAEEWETETKERLAKGLAHWVKNGDIKVKLVQDKDFWSQSGW